MTSYVVSGFFAALSDWEINMPGLQTILGQLNTAFGRDGIGELATKREMYGPGKSIATGIIVHSKMALHKDWTRYLKGIPPSMQEALRAIIYQALSTTPPTQITFAWAPGYDYELTVWHAPDTHATRGGITVLLKSRYPDDKHPLDGEPAHGS
jgi:hypothetical protein